MTSVIFATGPWPRGGTAGLAILDVPQNLAPLLVAPDAIGDRVAAFDIPANTFLTPGMLRPPGADLGDGDGLSRLRLPAAVELWPHPGPFGGYVAVIGPSESSCALIVTELLEVDAGGGGVTVASIPKPPNA